VRRSASLIGIAVLGLLGCQWDGDEAPSDERRETTTVVATAPPEQTMLTPKQELLRSITSCEVREILFTHEGVALVTFQGGRRGRVRLDKAAAENVAATAFRQRCQGFKRIIVGIE
jgi:hypothetical protein